MIAWEPLSIFESKASTSMLTAKTNCELFYISKKKMTKFMEYNPGLMLKLRLGNKKLLY